VRQSIAKFVLDVADHFAVAVTTADVEQHEGVEGVAMKRGVDPGVDDAVAGTAEEADHAQKEVRLIERVDHHFESLAERIEARPDHRLVGVDAIVQRARVPGDFLGRLTQEIHRIELLPQSFVRVSGSAK
jgi:hypothetical protein